MAWFVTGHGFGHAARAAAVMGALRRDRPGLHFDVYTTVPPWFFEDSLPPGAASHRKTVTDVGMVQRSPLAVDLAASLRALDDFYPIAAQRVDALARRLERNGTALVVCDIAPLGILAARRAGLPSVLIENFTWEWIYAGYADAAPGFNRHAARLEKITARADLRIRTRPVCGPIPGDLCTPPVARRPRRDRQAVRREMGLGPDTRMVLFTMGGGANGPHPLGETPLPGNICLVVPGSSDRLGRANGVLRLPARSGFYHPDLVHAADAVVAKLGYSTLAEVHSAGAPLGYVARDDFRESAELERFVVREMPAVEVPAAGLADGRWAARLEELLSLPRRTRGEGRDGADMVAEAIGRRFLE